MSKVGQTVLVPQAGYPQGKFRGSFDPAIGRGYRAGDRLTVPPGEERLLVNHGLQDQYFRWKVSLFTDTTDNTTYAPNTAFFLSVDVSGRNENDAIPRNTLVHLGRGQVLYVPGRSLRVTALNPTSEPLDIHYSLDEATPGLSAWTTDEQLTAAAETPLDIPSFTQAIQVFSTAAGVTWLLRGYDSTGTLAYSETLTVPRSASIPVVPSLFYTLQPTLPGVHTCIVVYSCVG